MHGQEDSAFPGRDHIHALAHAKEIKHPNHGAVGKKCRLTGFGCSFKKPAWPSTLDEAEGMLGPHHQHLC